MKKQSLRMTLKLKIYLHSDTYVVMGGIGLTLKEAIHLDLLEIQR